MNVVLRVCLLILLISGSAFFQTRKTILTCRQSTMAAFKSLPKMEYECPEDGTDSDDKLLKGPLRLKAIRSLVDQLEKFNNEAWWRESVDDLNLCEIHGGVGALNDDEKDRVKNGDYRYQLFGNHRLRLALLEDPCYQTGYNGSNAFLLYHQGGRVIVSQVLNGYYSRVDNSVGIDYATLNGEQIIEISTANSFLPSLTFYYFAIDPKTNKAVPKKMFKEGNKLTNEIYSAMLMNEPKDLGLPRDAGELKIIRHQRLAPSFSAYEEDERGKIDSDGRKLHRIIYRWNGRFYTP